MTRYSIRCNLLPNALKDGRHSVRFRVSWRGERVTQLLATAILPEEWDEKASMPIASQRRANQEIIEMTAAMGRLFDLCHIEQRVPSPDEVRRVLAGEAVTTTPKVVKHNIIKALDEYIYDNQRAGNWSDSTSIRWNGIRNHLIRWSPDLVVENVDEECVRRFVEHLYKSGLRNTTVAKNVSWFKSFLRWCRKKGYTSTDSWDAFKPRLKGNADDKEIVYLTQNELRSIIALDLTGKPHLDRVRDVLLFCCFTGLRYSDVAKLRQGDIHDGCVNVLTKKTDDSLRIELNNMSAAILDKYATGRVDDLALPVIANQKMNHELKELAKLADIDTPVRRVYWVKANRYEDMVPKYDLITSHCGRRTFVVSALTMEIPAEVIMRWTGHKDHDSMKPYIAIVDKQKKESMAKFNNFV